ncbi:MAG TPA: hypothetical protein VI479_10155 [Blastocatellia bacterium]
MNIKSIKTIGKKVGLSFALGAAFLVAAGAVDSSSAFAQGLRRIDRDHDGRIDTRRELIEERKGFNAGLIKGRADAIGRRKFNPFILHRRFVSNDYRQGFNKGYAQAYRQFAINRGHHFGRGF